MKKWLIVILKGFIIQAIQEQSPIFLSVFFFLIDCCMNVISISL